MIILAEYLKQLKTEELLSQKKKKLFYDYTEEDKKLLLFRRGERPVTISFDHLHALKILDLIGGKGKIGDVLNKIREISQKRKQPPVALHVYFLLMELCADGKLNIVIAEEKKPLIGFVKREETIFLLNKEALNQFFVK